MAMVTAELTRDVAGQPRGTLFEVDETDSRLVRGTLKLSEKPLPEPVDTTDVDGMKGPELRDELDKLGLDTKGKVSDLRDRLKVARGGQVGEHFDFHHAEPGAGSEESGEGVPAEDAANADLTNLDEGDKVEGRELFAGDPGEHPWGLDTKLDVDGEGESGDGDPETLGLHLGNELFAGDVTQTPGEHPLEIDTRVAETDDETDAGF